MDDNEFGNIQSTLPESEDDKAQVNFMTEQQRRLEVMVKDKKWIPLLEMFLDRIDYCRSMQWIDPSMSNDAIGENAKVAAGVIAELEGILNEVKALSGLDELRPSGLGSSTGSTKKPVQKRS